MREELRTLVFGAFFGALAAIGFLFILFWWVLFTAANAGVMVDGAFQPYRDDPSGYAILLGGSILFVGAVTGLAWGARRASRGESL